MAKGRDETYPQAPHNLRLGCYLQAKKIIRVVASNFASLHHKMLEFFVDLSRRILPGEEVTYDRGMAQKAEDTDTPKTKSGIFVISVPTGSQIDEKTQPRFSRKKKDIYLTSALSIELCSF